jgi:hypothetical protein
VTLCNKLIFYGDELDDHQLITTAHSVYSHLPSISRDCKGVSVESCDVEAPIFCTINQLTDGGEVSFMSQ